MRRANEMSKKHPAAPESMRAVTGCLCPTQDRMAGILKQEEDGEETIWLTRNSPFTVEPPLFPLSLGRKPGSGLACHNTCTVSQLSFSLSL